MLLKQNGILPCMLKIKLVHCLVQGLLDRLKQQSRNLSAIGDVEMFAGEVLARVDAGHTLMAIELHSAFLVSQSFTELPTGIASLGVALNLHMSSLTLHLPTVFLSALISSCTRPLCNFHSFPSNLSDFQLWDLYQLSVGPLGYSKLQLVTLHYILHGIGSSLGHIEYSCGCACVLVYLFIYLNFKFYIYFFHVKCWGSRGLCCSPTEFSYSHTGVVLQALRIGARAWRHRAWRHRHSEKAAGSQTWLCFLLSASFQQSLGCSMTDVGCIHGIALYTFPTSLCPWLRTVAQQVAADRPSCWIASSGDLRDDLIPFWNHCFICTAHYPASSSSATQLCAAWRSFSYSLF